jgi:hypothetical protein
MNRVTNKEIMEKLEAMQHDTSHKELVEKVDVLLNAVNTIQKNAADKETVRKLSDDTKKYMVMSYAVLSLAYLGLGLTILFASLNLITIEYSIVFGVFFGGSIILAFVAYAKRKELKNNSRTP